MADLKTLIGKLNPICRRALEKAAERCHGQTQFAVEIEHLLLALAETPDSDLVRACSAYGVASDRLAAQLTQAIDGFKRGNGRTPSLSAPLGDLLAAAWSVASLELGLGAIRSGALLTALLETDALRTPSFEAAPLLALIPRGQLAEDLPALIRGGAEDGPGAAPRAAGRADRSDHRPRSRDPPDHRYPDAAAPEQPDPDRRCRRRQDRDRRRLRPADRRRQGPAGARRNLGPEPRSGPPPGRRRDQGRVRAPPSPSDRRGGGLAQADRAVHRRGSYADRRRRCRGPRRCRQSAEAGARPRHPAHHRGHDLGRI